MPFCFGANSSDYLRRTSAFRQYSRLCTVDLAFLYSASVLNTIHSPGVTQSIREILSAQERYTNDTTLYGIQPKACRMLQNSRQRNCIRIINLVCWQCEPELRCRRANTQ
jgi:hypothetical protein